MGRRGPAGKPVAMHKKQGTFDASRHGKGQLPVQLPEMPSDMDPKAESCWKIISQQLFQAGVISEIDGKALRLICEADAVRLDALDDLRAKGMTIMGQSSPVQNPSVRAYFAAWDREWKGLLQCGMTPCSRRGMDLNSDELPDDDTARILKLKQA